MSVAWISCCVRLARISGHASASVARSSAVQAPCRSSGEMFWRRGPLPGRSCAPRTSKRFGRRAPRSASYGANLRGPTMNSYAQSGNCWSGSRTRWSCSSCCCFSRGLYGALSAARRRSRTACSTSTSTAAWSSSRRGAMVRRRRSATDRPISPARPGRGARQGPRRQPGESGRARPQRLHRRRRRPRSATLPMPSAGYGRPASRSSLMASATPTTATRSLRPLRRSGSIRWAAC